MQPLFMHRTAQTLFWNEDIEMSSRTALHKTVGNCHDLGRQIISGERYEADEIPKNLKFGTLSLAEESVQERHEQHVSFLWKASKFLKEEHDNSSNFCRDTHMIWFIGRKKVLHPKANGLETNINNKS